MSKKTLEQEYKEEYNDIDNFSDDEFREMVG